MKNSILLGCAIAEAYSTPEIFWGNVGDDYDKVVKQVNKTKDYETIKEIVNKYI